MSQTSRMAQAPADAEPDTAPSSASAVQEAPEVNPLVVNQVLCNTYILLAATLLFGAASAGITIAIHGAHPDQTIFVCGGLILLLVVYLLRNSKWGLVAVFALTGFIGYALGSVAILIVLGGTGLALLGLCAYAVIGRKDFTNLCIIMLCSTLVICLASVGSSMLGVKLPRWALIVLILLFVLLVMSIMLLWQSHRITNGRESNYIMATISIYAGIFIIIKELQDLFDIFSIGDGGGE